MSLALHFSSLPRLRARPPLASPDPTLPQAYSLSYRRSLATSYHPSMDINQAERTMTKEEADKRFWTALPRHNAIDPSKKTQPKTTMYIGTSRASPSQFRRLKENTWSKF